jgi:hypothetical protein
MYIWVYALPFSGNLIGKGHAGQNPTGKHFSNAAQMTRSSSNNRIMIFNTMTTNTSNHIAKRCNGTP